MNFMSDVPSFSLGPAQASPSTTESPTLSTSPPPTSTRPSEQSGPVPATRRYRTSRNRPCDRCRSRKQRCLTQNGKDCCINCDLAGGLVCTFLAATEPRRRPPKRLTTVGVNESAVPSFENLLNPIPHFQPSQTLSSLEPPSWLISAPPNSVPAITSVADLIQSTSTRLDHARPSSATGSAATEEYLSLDLEANDDEELSLVGTASEADALELGLLVADNSLDPTEADRTLAGVKIRTVSFNASATTVAFIYHPARPYQSNLGEVDPLQQMHNLVGKENIPILLGSYLSQEGQAVPIWSEEHFSAETKVTPILHCSYLATALIYHPRLRHLYHAAWNIIITNTAGRNPRARLSTIQAALIDLNARSGVNPAGNFVVFGQTIAVARLLGLHRDCSTWMIPQWERDLRTRIWWALLQYDMAAALSFGRAPVIGSDWDVPPPRRTPRDSVSYEAFVSLAELAVIQNKFLQITTKSGSGWTQASKPPSLGRSQLGHLTTIGLELDEWRRRLDGRNFFARGATSAPPGVRSLELMYLGTAVFLTRAAWDAVANDDERLEGVVERAQRSCLLAAIQMVDFVSSLSSADLGGYWPIYTPYLLSTTMVTLVRLTLSDPRTSQADDAIWQLAVFNLRRFLSTLSRTRDDAEWDPADLALSRAHYFVPLLAKKAPEFAVVLEPLQLAMPELSVSDQLEALLSSFITSSHPSMFSEHGSASEALF